MFFRISLPILLLLSFAPPFAQAQDCSAARTHYETILNRVEDAADRLGFKADRVELVTDCTRYQTLGEYVPDAQFIRLSSYWIEVMTYDDELAMVIAHEWSHHFYRNEVYTDPKAAENEADRLGMILLAEAGYDPATAMGEFARIYAFDAGVARQLGLKKPKKKDTEHVSYAERVSNLKKLALAKNFQSKSPTPISAEVKSSAESEYVNDAVIFDD